MKNIINKTDMKATLQFNLDNPDDKMEHMRFSCEKLDIEVTEP